MTNDGIEEGERLRDEAIDRVERGAPVSWLEQAEAAVLAVRGRLVEFTTDDVWAELDKRGAGAPPEPRAMGAVIRRLSKAGQITNTLRVKLSVRKECHRRPVAVWRSSWAGPTP